MTIVLGLLPTLGPMELFLILAIVLLLFGAAKLPQIGRGLGEGIRDFRKGLSDDEKAAAEDEGRRPGESTLPRDAGGTTTSDAEAKKVSTR